MIHSNNAYISDKSAIITDMSAIISYNSYFPGPPNKIPSLFSLSTKGKVKGIPVANFVWAKETLTDRHNFSLGHILPEMTSIYQKWKTIEIITLLILYISVVHPQLIMSFPFCSPILEIWQGITLALYAYVLMQRLDSESSDSEESSLGAEGMIWIMCVWPLLSIRECRAFVILTEPVHLPIRWRDKEIWYTYIIQVSMKVRLWQVHHAGWLVHLIGAWQALLASLDEIRVISQL